MRLTSFTDCSSLATLDAARRRPRAQSDQRDRGRSSRFRRNHPRVAQVVARPSSPMAAFNHHAISARRRLLLLARPPPAIYAGEVVRALEGEHAPWLMLSLRLAGPCALYTRDEDKPRCRLSKARRALPKPHARPITPRWPNAPYPARPKRSPQAGAT